MPVFPGKLNPKIKFSPASHFEGNFRNESFGIYLKIRKNMRIEVGFYLKKHAKSDEVTSVDGRLPRFMKIGLISSQTPSRNVPGPVLGRNYIGLISFRDRSNSVPRPVLERSETVL